MKKTLFSITIAFIAFISANAQEMNVDKILKNHFEAIGQEKLAEFKTMKMTGKIVTQGMELPFVMKIKRPGKVRLEADLQGSKMVQAYNGTEGYIIAPWMGTTDPQDLNDDQKKEVIEMGDIDGKLYNYKKKGSTIELVGTEDMEGTQVYKLKLTEKSEKEGEEGDVSNYFIDHDSFMILKTSGKRKISGNEIESETYFSNYNQVEGIAMAFSMESKMNGATMSQITIDELIKDEEMADDLFEKPVKEEVEDGGK